MLKNWELRFGTKLEELTESGGFVVVVEINYKPDTFPTDEK